MKVLIESLGAVASRARIGSHELVFDQPSSVPGGSDRGPSPLDAMAVSIAACAHYYAAAFLFARSLPSAGLEVVLEFEKSREPVPRIAKLAICVILPMGVPLKYCAALERAVRHCPAYGTLIHPPEVTLEFKPCPSNGASAA